MELMDKMITNLESQSLQYENAVTILAENGLYKALAYMSSVNKDFISPCNKLLAKLMELSAQEAQVVQKDEEKNGEEEEGKKN